MQGLYRRLSGPQPDFRAKAEGAACLHRELELLEPLTACPADGPTMPEDLHDWMQRNTQTAMDGYRAYLEGRRNGAARSYFTNRAHALYVLRALAPTKLVDGAWLYGLLQYWENPRYAELIRIYLQELGDGEADKNHVALYRSLLARHGLEVNHGLPESFYLQGTLQLALAWNAAEFLPEILGFNLGYEQLPLHLLITAYELNELGIDPYYFSLHITVDNAQSGHAVRAVRAVQDALPRLRHDPVFWQRVQRGCRLSGAGQGTTDIIAGFDIAAEVAAILARKSTMGRGAHSDYCRIDGRHVNEWLASAASIPAFLSALIDKGWIRLSEPAGNSRFWQLLQGPEAEMFGVFSPYELQVIHDWIRGPESADGKPYTEADSAVAAVNAPGTRATPRRASYKALKALVQRRGIDVDANQSLTAANDPPDADLDLLSNTLPTLGHHEQTQLLVRAMTPASHWTPAGLYATRLFAARL